MKPAMSRLVSGARVGDMKEVVRQSSIDVELYHLLKMPPSELLGVSTTAATALNELGIETIFDLSTSNLFASACAAMEMSNSVHHPGVLELHLATC
jgi:Na+-translocating ferredoxin:NAD+ oxidoreductase RnfE subunit